MVTRFGDRITASGMIGLHKPDSAIVVLYKNRNNEAGKAMEIDENGNLDINFNGVMFEFAEKLIRDILNTQPKMMKNIVLYRDRGIVIFTRDETRTVSIEDLGYFYVASIDNGDCEEEKDG